ncbi:MAG: penicillin-binding protein [Deltaproteobacteria bacterium HGW-Deltaproteobacteria-12]|jgi:cell division protein FtsI (penicillin-binding protein 3)|nr:MAG: penicillin-binding protein [Deltaproteobacteria bacterium HGW-Deltaproteobacteria-12]
MVMETKKKLKIRIVSVLLIFLILFIALLSRAFQLQILSGQKLKALAQRQQTTTLQLQPERGVIFDRNGEKLAVSIMADSVFADPSKIADPLRTSQQISDILHLDKSAVFKKISERKSFCWLARRISPEQAANVENANIEGIILVKEPKRFYPNGELAAHMLGFVGADSIGLEGLEKKYNEVLKGKPEKVTWARDAKGKKLFLRAEKTETQKDESINLVLTIDNRIQYLVETHLKDAVLSKGAKGGLAIVMDPQTGEILALANEGRFNPNNIRGLDPDTWRNRAITDFFDPGSTFKPFLVAAALEEKAIKETDKFYCENGSLAIADRIIHEANRKRHGNLAVPDILKYSSNIGSVKIAQKLGKEKFAEYIERFGFGARTGIDLPGESTGMIRPVQKWTKVDAATIAFGQGISVTAIQLISAMSAIANNGVLMKPYIVRGFADKNNRLIKMYTPTVVRKVVSPGVAKRLTGMLTEVVGAVDGTGKNARIVNVAVAGKTGTSQKFDFARGAYSSEKVRTSFMGFFPADNPQVAILVILDEPQRDKWGGVAAAPVFKNIGDQILNCFKTNIRETPVFEQEKTNKVQLISTSQALVPGQAAPDDDSVMPDFSNLTIREVMKKARERSIEVKITGNGWAVSQYPQAGTQLGEERVCNVTFALNN